MTDLVVATIFKREAGYLAEWLAWHRMVGVGEFWLWDNDEPSCPETHRILAPYIAAGIVSLVHMPGRKRQSNAYWEARERAERRRDDVKWVAVIDADEFLQPCDGGTMVQTLQRFDQPDVAGVVGSWACFGSSHYGPAPNSCIGSFMFRPPQWFHWNQLVKQVFRPGRVTSHLNPHEFPAAPGFRVVDTLGNTFQGAKRPQAVWDEFRVVHYITRSRDDYYDKLRRGFADQDRPRPDQWNELNRNDELDMSLAARIPELHRWLREFGSPVQILR